MTSPSFSSFSSGNLFLVFALGREGFTSVNLEVPHRDLDENRISALGFRISLSKEKIKEIAMLYLIPSKTKIAISHSYDSVMNPLVGFCSVHVDDLRGRLCFPFFSLLLNLLSHYNISLTQLVPNTIKTVIGFQLLCDEEKAKGFVTLFRIFFMLKSVRISGW